MSKKKKGRVPRLRFPEFRAAGKWEAKAMAELYCFQSTNTLSRDKLNYLEGCVKNIHYGDIHTKFSTLFDVTIEQVPFINESESVERVKPESYCVEGDIIFADASEDMEDVGKSIEIINANGEKILSGLHTLLARRLGDDLIVGFGGYLFKSGVIREQIKKEAQGAKVLGISSGRLSKIKVCFPHEKTEQQKIASCLSSLDALIAAQADKLDALKTHKRGLMQQLFPREGETVPRLRFPEFREAGEWEEKKLGEIAKIVASGDLDAACFSPVKTNEHQYPVYSNSVEKQGLYGYYSVPKFPRCSITITARGTLGVAFSRSHEFMGIGRLLVVSDFKNADPKFISECWNHLGKVPTEVTSIPQFTAVAAKATLLPIPPVEEQQKIASCLSSLDTLITAQADKLDALKTHKKGLMQQLFPRPEATAA